MTLSFLLFVVLIMHIMLIHLSNANADWHSRPTAGREQPQRCWATRTMGTVPDFSALTPPREKLYLREIYASGRGLIVAGVINAQHLLVPTGLIFSELVRDSNVSASRRWPDGVSNTDAE